MQFERMANRESDNLEEVQSIILQGVEGDTTQVEIALELFADYTFGRFLGENHSLALAEMMGYKSVWADKVRELKEAIAETKEPSYEKVHLNLNIENGASTANV